MTRHIVSLGGGGIVDYSKMRDYLLGLTGKERPRVCFLPTASGDSDQYVAWFYRAFGPGRCRPTDLQLFYRHVVDLRALLLEQDVIYVGGGNTANMLAVWRVHGVDAILKEAWEAGTVLCGPSAGGLCWFDCGVTDSFGLQLDALQDGLGFLSGSFCPHYDAEERRRPVYTRLVADGVLPSGYATDNLTGIHFVGTDLSEAVSTSPDAAAYRVERGVDGRAIETRLETRAL